jgi:acetyl esterase/lipase
VIRLILIALALLSGSVSSVIAEGTDSDSHFARRLGPFPLYEGEIPNSRPGPDREKHVEWRGMDLITHVSHPTYTVYLPPPSRASKAAVLVFPGGGYQFLSWDMEGQWIAAALQDRGIAAILVKYRTPNDEAILDKKIAPLQDAQRALIEVRRRAGEWGIDPQKVGAMGFSAGGHLAATLGTLFGTALVPNPDQVSLRPDFLILVYPVISFTQGRVHPDMRKALIGTEPAASTVRRFSGAQQVTEQTPPTLLLAASNDTAVNVDHSIEFYQALRKRNIPAQLVLFDRGEHGFFELTREEWMSPMWDWLGRQDYLRR